jgi:hypothetical protein
MLKTYIEKLKGCAKTLLYKYEMSADWGRETSFIIKKRINRWTGRITILEERTIRTAY